MLHLIWYIIVGLIACVVAKSVMHMHMTLLWTIVLGIVGSIVGGLVMHIFSRPREGSQFHPAGGVILPAGQEAGRALVLALILNRALPLERGDAVLRLVQRHVLDQHRLHQQIERVGNPRRVLG